MRHDWLLFRNHELDSQWAMRFITWLGIMWIVWNNSFDGLSLSVCVCVCLDAIYTMASIDNKMMNTWL